MHNYAKMYNFTIDTFSILKRKGEDPQVQRVLSELITQMSEDKLLVPKECIHIKSIIGQGENLWLRVPCRMFLCVYR